MTKPLGTLADSSADYIRKHGLTCPGDHILIAVSGGPDSIALLEVLACLKENLQLKGITVAHFDHRLRGEESDADREFVQMFAAGKGFDCHIGTTDVRAYSRKKRVSLEMAGRACRHSFLKESAMKAGASKTAFGHTADDQAEEVLLRIFRGAGPSGLRAMLPRTPTGIIRPLLFATRSEILDYLHSRGVAYREDSSNFEPFCQRNALRLRVFPVLGEIFHPELARTISRYAELSRDEDAWWHDQVEKVVQDLGEVCEAEASLDLGALRAQHPAMIKRVLRYTIEKLRGNLLAIHSVHLEPLYSMATRDMPGKSVQLPGAVEAVQRAGRLVISMAGLRKCKIAQTEPLEIPGAGTYAFGAFTFEVELVDSVNGFPLPDGAHSIASDGPNEIVMDAGLVKWPLLVRSWKPGDRFYPFGMKGSKKIQDFFTDLKVQREDRPCIPILCDSEKICWVAGFRMDDRVKTNQGTLRLARIRMLDRATGGEGYERENS
ncbi:MAG: tRNA lysidine(34) synthetase TilS [Syntrophobacteraceae bacterium]